MAGAQGGDGGEIGKVDGESESGKNQGWRGKHGPDHKGLGTILWV